MAETSDRLKNPEMLLEWAWVIIANANHGDWSHHPDWKAAAEKWRNAYFDWQDSRGLAIRRGAGRG